MLSLGPAAVHYGKTQLCEPAAAPLAPGNAMYQIPAIESPLFFEDVPSEEECRYMLLYSLAADSDSLKDGSAGGVVTQSPERGSKRSMSMMPSPVREEPEEHHTTWHSHQRAESMPKTQRHIHVRPPPVSRPQQHSAPVHPTTSQYAHPQNAPEQQRRRQRPQSEKPLPRAPYSLLNSHKTSSRNHISMQMQMQTPYTRPTPSNRAFTDLPVSRPRYQSTIYRKPVPESKPRAMTMPIQSKAAASAAGSSGWRLPAFRERLASSHCLLCKEVVGRRQEICTGCDYKFLISELPFEEQDLRPEPLRPRKPVDKKKLWRKPTGRWPSKPPVSPIASSTPSTPPQLTQEEFPLVVDSDDAGFEMHGAAAVSPISLYSDKWADYYFDEKNFSSEADTRSEPLKIARYKSIKVKNNKSKTGYFELIPEVPEWL